jgi:hypothetical protein
LVTFLLSSEAAAITGRFLSAKWDPVPAVRAWAAGGVNPSRYTLRRIDEALFAEAGDGAAG